MAIIGPEWLILVAVILIVFLWGPQKLPELAKSIGLAKKEFDKAAKEISNPTLTGSSGTANAGTDPLIVAARSLGISTEGKTKEQIAKEIAEKSASK